MRVNTLLIASLTGAAYAHPIETVPEGNILQDVEGLIKLPVGPRQLGGLTRPLNGLGGSALGGSQGGPLDQVTNRLPVTSLGGLSKRAVEAIAGLVNVLEGTGFGGLGKRELDLEQVEDKLGALSLVGLKERQVDLGELTRNKLGGLAIDSNDKRQVDQVTDRLDDLSLVGIVRRQVQALAGTLHGLTGQRQSGLVNSLGGVTDSDKDLPLVGDATDNLPVAKRALVDTNELTTGLQLEGATDELRNVHLLGLLKRQIKGVTDLLGEKMVKTLPIIGRGLGMQCVKDASGKCKSEEEHKSTLHATNDPKLDVVKEVTDALVL